MPKKDIRSDGEIIVAVRGGDKEAYRGIVERYMRRAYRIAIGFVGNPEDALDVSQIAFIKAFRNLRKFDTSKPFFPWLYAILRNQCLDHLKQAHRSREVPLETVSIRGNEQEDHVMQRTVWHAIENLPVQQREVVVLRYFQDMSYKEIAETLAKPIGTVMSSLYHARRRLRASIQGSPGFDRGIEEQGHGSR